MFEPEQIVEGPVATGAAGIGFTAAVVVPAGLEQPDALTINVYTPDARVLELAIVGFCEAEVKPFGPVQLYIKPPGNAVRLRFCPAQIGPLLETVGTAGAELIVTASVL